MRVGLLKPRPLRSSARRRRPLKSLHLVGRRHSLELDPCRLACFANVDSLGERQVPDHGLLHVSELAGPRQAPNLANENVESFVRVLCSLVEDVALVGYVHRPHTELFERVYKFGDILLVIRWEGEAAVRVVSFCPTHVRNISARFSALVSVRSAART